MTSSARGNAPITNGANSGNSGGPDSTVLLDAARPVESAANRLDSGEFLSLAREFASAAEANQRGIYYHADYLTVIHDANAMGTICGRWHLPVERIVDPYLDPGGATQ